MTLESTPSTYAGSTQTPPLGDPSRGAFTSSTFQIFDGSERKPREVTLVGSPVELATLRTKALRSIELCERTVADLLRTISESDDGRDRLAGEAKARVLAIETKAVAIEAFFASAKGLVASSADPDHARIASPPKAQTSQSISRDADLKTRLGQLTLRQKCVFKLVSQGLSNKIIAYELGITETTVKAHVGVILQKLGVYSRVRAIALLNKLKSETDFEF